MMTTRGSAPDTVTACWSGAVVALLGAGWCVVQAAPVELAGALAVGAALGVLGAALATRRRRLRGYRR